MRRELTEFRSGEFTLRATCDWPDTGQGRFPAVFYCHGFTGNRFETRRSYARLTAMLAHRGIAGFRFDHRGCGESDGDFLDFTPAGMLEDLDAALAHFQKVSGFDVEKAAVVGYSLGGASASYVLSRGHAFQTAVLWAPVARPEIIRDRLAQYPKFAGYEQRGYFDCGGFRVNPLYLDGVGEMLEPLKWIEVYKPPILVLQGEVDEIVKPEQAERYMATRNNPGDQLVIIPDGDHAFGPVENMDRVLDLTAEWLVKRLM